MKRCVMFGGAGYVGTHLARHFLKTKRFDHIHIADIRRSPLEGTPRITTSRTDVRRPIEIALAPPSPEWIFNLAAVHREPGHAPCEYYETNLPGAANVCDYAEVIGCDNIYFTSSISVYGPTVRATDEKAPIRPITPYGGSKYAAEAIHQQWRRNGHGRRLLISRPGVLYGPDDPGNIMRMIKAIQKGYFAFPGKPSIYKSYGYIYGFLVSIDFLIDRGEEHVVYNYVESPTQPLCELVEAVKQYLQCRALVLPLPLRLLLPVSKLVQAVAGYKNPIHPVRVKKAATPTHIVPQTLIDMGFKFEYSFLRSLEHWRQVAPHDFEPDVLRNLPSVERSAATTRSPVIEPSPTPTAELVES